MKINVDGVEYNSEKPINGFELLKLINNEKYKDSIVFKLNDSLKNMSHLINESCKIEFISKYSKTGLEVIRHSTAHLLSVAVKSLFPNVKLSIGPSIENGFYYDFDREQPFSTSDFETIEKKMNELIKEDLKFSYQEVSKEDAIKYFKSVNEPYKVELINDILDNEPITIYQLDSIKDLCRGPHVPSTRYLKYFKLTKVAGAYWKGDSKNKMLQRIYGTAWATKEDLDKYFQFLLEAEKRDHKKIVKSMDLAHFESEYAPGAVFYHPKGFFIYNTLIEHMRKKQEEMGYIEVSTPRVMDRHLWEISGHWEKYGQHNYSGTMEDNSQFCIKPMNCPGAILVYNNKLRSYKDLPIKMAEFGKVNRYEASGALNGFLRVREFTQDDAHIFCTPEQMEDEIIKTIKFCLNIYSDFGFKDVVIKLATRPENTIGSKEIWDLSEKCLADSLKKINMDYVLSPGEGAFYGPKLEFTLKDALNRDWQVGTIQVDMNLPPRFNMSYIGRDGEKHEPVMIHRAILGSIERFLGILIENTEGKFPLWLNPTQGVILNINDNVKDYCVDLCKKFKEENLRIDLDLSNETLNYKIRENSLKKIPFLIIVGDKEKQNNSITLRIFGNDKQISMNVNDFISKLKTKIKNKSNDFELD